MGWKSCPGICFEMQQSWVWWLFWSAVIYWLSPPLNDHVENLTVNSFLFLISAVLGTFASFFTFFANVCSLQKRTKIPIPNSQERTTMGPAIGPVTNDQGTESPCVNLVAPFVKLWMELKGIVRVVFAIEVGAERILTPLYLRMGAELELTMHLPLVDAPYVCGYNPWLLVPHQPGTLQLGSLLFQWKFNLHI